MIGVRRGGGRPAYLARGCFPGGAQRAGVVACAIDPDRGGPTASTLIYTASLAKQVTAACAALIGLDVQTPVGEVLPELPPWSRTVRIRHLIHHTSGLPLEGTELETVPGTRFAYSNAGYVLLARAIGSAAGEPLPSLAQRLIFAPLGMTSSGFWAGPEARPPGAAPLDLAGAPPPLSIGDGGLWSTAEDLLCWADALDRDRLGIRDVVQQPGRLDDGTRLDYAWGMGVRSRAGVLEYRHGGGYADLRAMLVRVPDLGVDLVMLALDDRTERRIDLTGRMLAALLA